MNFKFNSLILGVFIFASSIFSQDYKELEKFLPTINETAVYTQFGRTIAVDGEHAVVGALNSENGDDNISFVFHYNGTKWVKVANLTATNCAPNSLFGISVDISGDVIAIGAYMDNRDKGGSVFIFEKPTEGWNGTINQSAVLTSSVGQPNDVFGHSVDIEGDIIAVGASRSDYSGPERGAVFMYKKPTQGWKDTTETAILSASEGDSLAHFGYSVSLHNDILVVGAYGQGNETGAAYIFEKPGNGWTNSTEATKLTDAEGESGDRFGIYVNIEYPTIAVGSYHDSSTHNEQGSIVVFEKNSTTWEQKGKLTAKTPSTNAWLGNGFDILGDVIVAGTYKDNNETGAVYIFEKPTNGWTNSSETKKIIAADETMGDRFGISTMLYDSYLFVGAHWNDDMGTNSGAVYVYKKPTNGWGNLTDSAQKITAPPHNAKNARLGHYLDMDWPYAVATAYGHSNYKGIAYVYYNNGAGWSKIAELKASDGEFGDSFGIIPCIKDDMIVVGAFYDDNEKGSAYVFKKPATGWTDMTETAKLTASDGESGDRFGRAVDIYNNTVIIGAYHDDDETGSAYIFEKPTTGWKDNTEIAKLTGSNISNNSYLAASVAINDEVAALSYSYTNDTKTGAVYLYKKPLSGWTNMTESAVLTASDNATKIRFGYPVTISENTLITGCYHDDDNGYRSGSAYIFQKPLAGWASMTETAKLLPSDGNNSDRFGWSIDLSGNIAVIGAYENNDNGTNSGSAYVYISDDNWESMTETYKILPEDGNSLAKFGYDVSISENQIMVGASEDDDVGVNSGSVYFFENLVNIVGKKATFKVLGNSKTGTSVGYVSAFDLDNDVLSYSISEGNTKDAFAINSETGEITVNKEELEQGTFYLTITATDGNNSGDFIVNVIISNIVVENKTFEITESVDSADVVGTVIAKDADGDALTFSIASGNEKEAFAINPETGVITVNYKDSIQTGSSNFNVRVTDGNTSSEASITVIVKNIVADDATFSIDENSAKGTVIGAVSATDSENDKLKFIIGGGNENNTFAIDSATGKITVLTPSALDYETTKVFVLGIKVSDGVNTDEAIITININDVDEPNSISDVSFATNNVFPNPAGNIINVNLTGINANQLSIVDLTGKTIITRSNPQQIEAFEIADLKHGLYFIRIQTESEIITGKFIKK